MINITLRCPPPQKTAQQKRLSMRRGRPVFFKPDTLRSEARTWAVLLQPHRPERPMVGPLSVSLRLIYPHRSSTPKRHRDRLLPKVSRPDCDNAGKELIDTLAKMQFLNDDSWIARLQIEKLHGPDALVGIQIQIAAFVP